VISLCAQISYRELAGLEPATFWVRYGLMAVEWRRFGLFKRSGIVRSLRFSQFGRRVVRSVISPEFTFRELPPIEAVGTNG
jgi:hypothetical protein